MSVVHDRRLPSACYYRQTLSKLTICTRQSKNTYSQHMLNRLLEHLRQLYPNRPNISGRISART